jgi:hypothetical protein
VTGGVNWNPWKRGNQEVKSRAELLQSGDASVNNLKGFRSIKRSRESDTADASL